MLDDIRDEYGISESALGLVIGVGFIAGFVAQVAIAPLADRGYARRLVVIGLGLDVVGPRRDGRAPRRSRRCSPVASPWASASASPFPALRRIAIVADPANLGSNLGSLLAAEVAGFAAGPAIAAVLVGPFGISAPFLVTAAAGAVALPFVARLPVAETAKPARQHFAFDLLRQRSFAGAVALGCGVYLMIGTFDALWSVALDDLGTGGLDRQPRHQPVRPPAGPARRDGRSPLPAGRAVPGRHRRPVPRRRSSC